MQIKSDGYIAFKCTNCNLINVFSKTHSDGNVCKCGGYVIALGDAVVSRDNDKNIIVGISVDTTELDKALDKAKELKRIIDSATDKGCI